MSWRQRNIRPSTTTPSPRLPSGLTKALYCGNDVRLEKKLSKDAVMTSVDSTARAPPILKVKTNIPQNRTSPNYSD